MSRKKPASRARVLIVDDHPAVREALALRIGRQPDLEVCGEAADISEALRLLSDARPDVAVVDIPSPVEDRVAAKSKWNW
jgi:DNA-binding NarL/FixJ family response regulator